MDYAYLASHLARDRDRIKIGISKIHIIRKVTKFHIYIKSLAKYIYFYTIVALQLEPITCIFTKSFEITVIKENTTFINEHNCIGIKHHFTNIFRVK